MSLPMRMKYSPKRNIIEHGIIEHIIFIKELTLI